MRLWTASLLSLWSLAMVGGCRTKAKLNKPSAVLECGTRPFKPEDAALGCDENGRFYEVGCIDDDEGYCIKGAETAVWVAAR
jgi:hypothetical protein